MFLPAPLFPENGSLAVVISRLKPALEGNMGTGHQRSVHPCQTETQKQSNGGEVRLALLLCQAKGNRAGCTSRAEPDIVKNNVA